MANFDAFAAVLLEIYSPNRRHDDFTRVCRLVASLTGAERSAIALAREPACTACEMNEFFGRSSVDATPAGFPSLDYAASGRPHDEEGGLALAGLPSCEDWSVCKSSTWQQGEDHLQLSVKLKYKNPNGYAASTGSKLVSALIPHFRRAHEISRLETAGSPASAGMLSSLLETFSGKMAILGPGGHMIECNRAFSELMAGESLVVQEAGGIVAFLSPLDQQEYQTALENRKPSAFFSKQNGREPMVVTVHPVKNTTLANLRGSLSAEDGAAQGADDLMLLWIRTKQPEGVSLQFLQSLFGLTRAETRVTEYVVQGLSLDEVAERIGVSKITARNQLTSAMSKLGVNRQAQLVTLILNMFPRLSGT